MSSANIFLALPLIELECRRQLYIKLIAEQDPNYLSPMINKKTGNVIQPSKMIWMVPAWVRGLAMVNEAISQLTIHNSQ